MYSFQELAIAFEQNMRSTWPFAQEPASLYDPCRYLLEWGGKRVRPVVCLMANELFGEITQDAWQAAKALELFHNFTLVHDDIMDRAPLRRGKPTIHEQYGLTAGILSGDVLCIYAYQQLQHIKFKLPETLAIFNATAIQVCEGQQLDMDFEAQDEVSIAAYIQMITLKTSVLLAASMKMGALLGGATEGNANRLYEFGKNLGIAFQLRDDYLDAFGAPENTGKQIGGDIMANKKTYLLLQALQSQAHNEELLQWLQRNDADKVQAVKHIMQQSGAAAVCLEAIQSYSQMAFDALEEVAVISKRKAQLYDVANKLLDRQA